MDKILQRFNQPITIIGGGEFDSEIFEYSLQIGQELIAVDGGLNYLIPNIHFPKWIIGDLDSAENTEYWVNNGANIKYLPEQDSTDFDKCLYSIEAPLYLANGFLGNRVDHTLASCSTLVKSKDKNIILLGKNDLIVHLNKIIVLELKVGTRISFFPLEEVSGLCCSGLKYSIAGVNFSPKSIIGTSNETTSPTVEISFNGPGMLLILPIDCLPNILEFYSVTLDA